MSEVHLSELHRYVDAVSRRHALNPQGGVNVAVLMELENNDIPRLLEIIRLQDAAIREIIDRGSVDDDQPLTGNEAEHMMVEASTAHLKVEELAAHGSKARWGDYVEEQKQIAGEDDGN